MGPLHPLLPLVLLVLLGSTVAKAADEPRYKITRYIGKIEVRTYDPYVVAEVLVKEPANDAGGSAFPILAGYISGKNKGAKRLPMTAPVTQAAVSTKLPMLAPVVQAVAPGGFVVQFILPRGTTLGNAPEPMDTRVSLHDVPARQVAVIRYSGLWTDTNYREHLAILQHALINAHEVWDGEPIYARYNAPFTPWFLRRNEIWLRIP